MGVQQQARGRSLFQTQVKNRLDPDILTGPYLDLIIASKAISIAAGNRVFLQVRQAFEHMKFQLRKAYDPKAYLFVVSLCKVC